MIRSEELFDKLIADLHFHNYIGFVGDDIMGNNRNCAISNKKKQVLIDYIDDVYIDYFFRTYSFKPIIIPKGFDCVRYTNIGEDVNINAEITLCLNEIYDRYTFVDFIFRNFFYHSYFMEQQFPKNAFLHSLSMNETCYGVAGFCNRIQPSDLMGYGYEKFIESEEYNLFRVIDRRQQKDFGIHSSASMLMKFNIYCKENSINFKFPGLTLYGINNISNIIRDYIKIKDSHLFGDYTIEEILLIYSLLLEKFKFEPNKLSTFVPMFVDVDIMKNNIVGQFNKFETSNVDYKIIEQYIFTKDLYLRFSSCTKSKAFKIKYIDGKYVEIQFFNETPIKVVYNNNSLPLPYLYSSQNNNKYK